MNNIKRTQISKITRKLTSLVVVGVFSTTLIFPSYLVQAQGVFNLPAPGTMIAPSISYYPATMAGMTIYPENPLKFDFIITTGDDNLEGEEFKKESQKLINYFLATLTVPDDEMWVNLSPYEKDRIIADGLGATEMGRDMLVQDYMLKQLTASLMYPEEELGNEFWKKVYKKSQAKFGTTEIPTNTFNKVWIVPKEAVVYVNGTNVFVSESHLKVMLEEDYLLLEANQNSTKHGLGDMAKNVIETMSKDAKEVIREIILPEIEREVNEGKNFANLRQIYHAMILATWYKQNLKESVLGKVYMDKNKVKGIDLEDKQIKEKIYNQYVEAFKEGVYNYIREDRDPVTHEIVPRKYFSGGLRNLTEAVHVKTEGGPSAASPIAAARSKVRKGKIGALRVRVETPFTKEKQAASPVTNVEANPTGAQATAETEAVLGFASLYSRTPDEIEIDNKKILTYLALERLYAQIKEGDNSGISELKFLVSAQPGYVNADVLQHLLNATDGYSLSNYEAMVEFVIHRPDLIDEQFVVQLMESLDQEDGYYPGIVSVLVSITEHKPTLIDRNVVEAIMRYQGGNSRDVFNYSERRKLLVAIVKTHEKFARRIVARLNNELKVRRKGLLPRALHAAEILGEINEIFPELVDMDEVSTQLARLKESQQATARFFAVATKLHPEILDKQDVRNFLEKVKSKEFKFDDSDVLNALTGLVKTKQSFIEQEFVNEIIAQSTTSIEFGYSEGTVDALYAISQISDEYYGLVVTGLWEKHTDTGDLLSGITVGPLLDGLFKKDISISLEILGKAVAELKSSDNDPFSTSTSSQLHLLTNIAKVIPGEFNEGLMDEIFEATESSDRFMPLLGSQEKLAEIAYEISKVDPELGKKILARAIKEPEYDSGHILAGLSEGSSLEINSMRYILKVSPELLTEDMVRQATGILLYVPGPEDDRDWRDEPDRLAAGEFLIEAHKLRPDLISAEMLLQYYLDRPRGAVVSRGTANPLTGILYTDGVDFDLVELYKSNLMSRWNIPPLRRDDINNALLINTFLTTRGENANLLGKFAFQDDREFESLVFSVLSYIKAGQNDEIIRLLHSHSDVNQATQEISDNELLSTMGLEIFAPTRSWDNLESWIEALSRLPHLSYKIIPHIIVTMELLKQGIGEQAGFRGMDSVEDRLPRIRRSLAEALKITPSLIDKKRLTKVLSLGTRDEVELLRRQAILMVQAATGLGDSRQNVVGRIRNRIHNQQSPQDLHVVRAYRDYVDTGNEEGLRFYGYEPTAVDVVEAERKEETLRVTDELISTLEFIYGDENLTSMGDFLGSLTLGDGEWLKEKVNAFVDDEGADNQERLNAINVIRRDVYAFIQQAEGEALLSAIRLDNRLELLYYKYFNEVKESVNASDLLGATQFLKNILENVALSGYSTKEIEQILQEIEELEKERLTEVEMLKLYALLKRVENIIRLHAKETVDQYQEMAHRLGASVGVENNIWVENFSSNFFRADTIYLLSSLLNDVKREVMERSEISGWQVVVPGETEGRLRILSSLDELSDVKPDEIIVIEHLPSDTPPITDVRAIIVLTEDSLLSHPAINARQHNIPMVAAPNLDALKRFEGKNVTLTTVGDEDVSIEESQESEGEVEPSERLEVEVQVIEPIEANLSVEKGFIVDQGDYQKEDVGNKAFRLGKVSSKYTDRQKPTNHFALRFGMYHHVLNLPENEGVKREMDHIYAALQKESNAEAIAKLLLEQRLAVRRLVIPPDILAEISDKIRTEFGTDVNVFVRSTTNVEDLAHYAGAGLYDSYGNIKSDPQSLAMSIKNVWASIWNYRAYLDRELHGIDHAKAMPAVLIQETVTPNYAFVVHTENPSNPDELVIELVQGFGESLVSGSEDFIGSPYRYIYNRTTRSIKMVRFSSKGKMLRVGADGEMGIFPTNYMNDPLSNGQALSAIEDIVKASLQVESRYGVAQDIEGAIVIDGTRDASLMQFSLLQTRNQANQASSSVQLAEDRLVPVSADEAEIREVGGIDFNPNTLNLSEQGQAINFTIDNSMFQNLQPNAVNGVVPVIINITPVVNFPLLIGEINKEEEELLSFAQ